MLHLFIDTNIFLHYPPVGDIDWVSLCNTEEIKLVVCMQVIHELDNKKNDHMYSQRAKRAIANIKSIRSAGGHVRNNISLVIFNHEYKSTDFPATLSQDSNDDRIIYLAKKFHESHPDSHLAVCTEDYGMNLRCELHKLDVIELDDSIRLPSLRSEEQKKHVALQNELNELKIRQPKIKLDLAQDTEADIPQHIKKLSILRTKAETTNLDALVEEEKNRFSDKHPSPDSIPKKSLDIIVNQYSRKSLEKYNNDLIQYLSDYRTYLKEAHAYQNLLGPVTYFSVNVSNLGKSPANDIEIEMSLPNNFSCIYYNKNSIGEILEIQPERPKPPNEPANRLAEITGNFTGIERDWAITHTGMLKPTFNTDLTKSAYLKGDEDTGFTIGISIARQQHYTQSSFGPFVIMLKPNMKLQPFQINTITIASDLPEPIHSVLSFIPQQITNL